MPTSRKTAPPDAGVRIAFVTAPNAETGRALARAVLERRLAACVNVVPGVESHYWWDGALQCDNEVLLIVKTTAARLQALEECVRRAHPYDVPEFVHFRIDGGSAAYLAWLKREAFFSTEDD